MDRFCSTSKSILKEITNHFKVSTLTVIQDSYNLRILIETQDKLSDIWKMGAEELLRRGDFADAEMTVSCLLQF